MQCVQPDQMFFLKKLLALILFSPQILSSRTPFSGLRWWKLFHLFDSDLLHKPDSICAFFGKSYPQLSGTFPLAGYLEAAGSLCMVGSPSKDSKILSVMFCTAHIPAVLEKSSKYYFFTDKTKQHTFTYFSRLKSELSLLRSPWLHLQGAFALECCVLRLKDAFSPLLHKGD